MDKWEYLYMRTSGPNGVQLLVLPSQKVNLDWVLQKHPKAKAITDGYEFRLEEVGAATREIFDYLGSDGWEAYSIWHRDMAFGHYFKRRL